MNLAIKAKCLVCRSDGRSVLLRLSATYNNLEGGNVGRVASAESCHVSVISPDARVATLLWPTSLKKTRKGLCPCVLYHRMFDDNSRQLH